MMIGTKTTNLSSEDPTCFKTFGYRTRTMIGFWNVCTMCDKNCMEDINSAKFQQVEKEFSRFKIDILGVSETRWLGSGLLRTSVEHNVFLYSGDSLGSKRLAGVGFLMTP